jgi:hypothetical protein
MNGNAINLLLAVGLLGTGVALAQAPPTPGGPKGEDALAKPADATRQLYEEIEIMRRILDRDLRATLPAGTGSLGFSALTKDLKEVIDQNRFLLAQRDVRPPVKGDPHGASEWHGPHGIYLKGCGVVYSGALPMQFHLSVMGDSDTANPAQPPSQWERIRKEMHGEKVEAEKEGQRKVPPLSEVVLKALAENGKHFTQLPENEQVTVGLTLFQSQSCVLCHVNPWQDRRIQASYGLSPMPQYLGDPFNAAQPNPTAGGITATSSTSGPPGTSSPSGLSQERIEAHRQLLTGDLHAKQNQMQNAIELYEKAWVTYRKLLDEERKAGGATSDLQLNLEVAELLGKLGQCYRAQGDSEKARRIVTYLAGVGQKTGLVDSPPPAGASPLPAKLIVSASKKLLDQVGAGKMSFDEFKKAATVQYLDFAAKTDKEPAKP